MDILNCKFTVTVTVVVIIFYIIIKEYGIIVKNFSSISIGGK